MIRYKEKKMLKIALGAVFIVGLSSANLNPKTLKKSKMNQFKKEYSNVGVFLKNPTKYSFTCSETSKGEVLSAQLSFNGDMTITYRSIWDDGDHSGKATGKYNKNTHRFDGRYKTNDNRFEGEINFIFDKNGEARGTWDYGVGIILIELKK